MKDIIFSKTMSIRVPSLLTNLVTAEVLKRNFLKKNGKGNENEFFNKMLPNMIDYRDKRRKERSDFIAKKAKGKVAIGDREALLDAFEDYAHYLLFEDKDDECDDTINLRFDVKLEAMYTQLFVHITERGLKRSVYLRGLIYEYFQKAEHEKERICFYDEYCKLKAAMDKSLMLYFECDGVITSAAVVAIEFSATKEHWFVLYFKENDYEVLHSALLYKIKRIVQTSTPIKEIGADTAQAVHGIIERGEYSTEGSYSCRGESDA